MPDELSTLLTEATKPQSKAWRDGYGAYGAGEYRNPYDTSGARAEWFRGFVLAKKVGTAAVALAGRITNPPDERDDIPNEGTENLTAERALDEVLNRATGSLGDWRRALAIATEQGFPDTWLAHEAVTFGDLRRWAAPLLATEG